MLVARIVTLSCVCGHQFKGLIKLEDGWKRPCPACGAVCSPETRSNKAHFNVPLDYSVQSDQGESIVDGYHPDEVPEARTLLPTHDIQADGTVRYRDAAHRRACYSEQASVFGRERERNRGA